MMHIIMSPVFYWPKVKELSSMNGMHYIWLVLALLFIGTRNQVTFSVANESKFSTMLTNKKYKETIAFL